MNFGIAYGIGGQRLAFETGLSQGRGRRLHQYIPPYVCRCDCLHGRGSLTRATLRTGGYAARPRSQPARIHSMNPGLRQGAERAAINMPVQGTAADIMKLAMIKVATAMHERRLSSTMILQVHDELVFEVPPDEIDEMAALVHEGMSTAIELDVPLAVDVNVGPSWGSLERRKEEAAAPA